METETTGMRVTWAIEQGKMVKDFKNPARKTRQTKKGETTHVTFLDAPLLETSKGLD